MSKKLLLADLALYNGEYIAVLSIIILSTFVFMPSLEIIKGNRTLLAVLVDPEKIDSENFEVLKNLLSQDLADTILIGGSTTKKMDIDPLIQDIKKRTKSPIVLFPGHQNQLSSKADAILLPSLLSGESFNYAFGKHIQSAQLLDPVKDKIVTTGYILLDGNVNSSAAKVTKTTPISTNNIELILNTCIAAEIIGFKSIYLEAGSGAVHPLGANIIKTIKKNINIPLIVGGGIDTIEKLSIALSGSPDLIVIGNALESNPNLLIEFAQCVRSQTELELLTSSTNTTTA